MIELHIPPRATEAALHPFLEALRQRYEPGKPYMLEGELRPDGVLILRARTLTERALAAG